MTPDRQEREISVRELAKAVLVRLLIVVAIIVTYALVAGMMLFLMVDGGERFGITKPALSNDQEILQNYIEWFSVFYTLVLSFIISQGWRRYQRINSEIDREADALILLLRTSEMCNRNNKKLKDELTRIVLLYVKNVKLARGNDRRSDSVSAELMKQIHVRVKQIVKKEAVPECVKSQLLYHYCEAYDARGDRFDMAAQRLPKIVWLLMILVSLTWLWGFVWLDVKSPGLKIYMSVGVLGVVSFLYFIARDLDNLSIGYFKVNFSPFEIKTFDYKENDEGSL
ncbi:MAG: DUF4239 domain-containing protein [bacterium]